MPAQAARSTYEELARHLGGLGAVRRELVRALPADCPPGSAGVLTLLHKYGEMRMGRLAELMAVDMSVTSRHVTHNVERGWVERQPDPEDARSRLLRLTERGERQLDTLSEATTVALESILHDWSEEDVAGLNGMLERLRADFGDCRVTAPAASSPSSPARTAGTRDSATTDHRRNTARH
ncbi:DNA-binding MarR family transcriptional regulator [Streptomyces sp. Amel2xB2]|uniref:MarR family transcriptional regulator n=1 Tax=Streptomyces nanshensis TaxID=518642 RepID=A0A1E7KP48_9ACTN|nr:MULTISPECIES: MarR family transcriptional regulator [Streptomyces]OEV05664.1 MarR family transcriptional regulator [Streptomyces nanshensis]RAJ61860.1 DNA-binding MarR family transcriptional regulator [Streptomyces sp. Amel2xB2]